MSNQAVILTEKLKELTIYVQQIQNIMVKENTFLKDNDFIKFSHLQAEKEALATNYEKHFLQFKAMLQENKISLPIIDSHLESEIKEIAENFQHICDQNLMRLQAKENTNNFIIQQVLEAAKEKTRPQTYDVQGHNKKKAEKNIPLVFNKEL